METLSISMSMSISITTSTVLDLVTVLSSKTF